jgi:hypothetical protein
MNSQRAQAYGRLMKTLSDLSAAKFNPREEQIFRDAADSLFFCEDIEAEPGARESLDAAQELAGLLVANDRLLPETVDGLMADLEGCGPLEPATR